MNYKQNTERLVRSYENAVAFGGAEHEPSLQDAIKAAFTGLSDEGQAELYARIADAWESYRSGFVPRKLWIGQIVSAFMADRMSTATSGLKVHDNMPKELKPQREGHVHLIPGSGTP